MKTQQLPVVLLAHELKANGYSLSTISTRCASGQLVRLRRGAYLSAGVNQELTPKDWVLSHHLAAAKLYRKSALSHASAALLWGAPLTALPATIHLSIPTVSKRSRNRVTLHCQRPEVVARAHLHRDVRVTAPQDTVADCTRTLPLIDALMIADWFLQQQKCTRAETSKWLCRWLRAKALPLPAFLFR